MQQVPARSVFPALSLSPIPYVGKGFYYDDYVRYVQVQGRHLYKWETCTFLDNNEYAAGAGAGMVYHIKIPHTQQGF